MTERERLTEILKAFCTEDCKITHQCGYCDYGDLPVCASAVADHLLANGVIVPPCKVGDEVWFLNIYPSIDMKQNAVYEAKVVRVYIEKGTVLILAVQVKTGWGTTEFPRITDIGKTVFLTKEEAEKALAERQSNA